MDSSAIDYLDKPNDLEAFHKCFDEGVLIRVTADTIALSPPLIVEKNQIDRIFDTIGGVLKTVD